MRKTYLVLGMFTVFLASYSGAAPHLKPRDASIAFKKESALPPQDSSSRTAIPAGNVMTPAVPGSKWGAQDQKTVAESSHLSGATRFKRAKIGEGKKK